MEEYTPTEQRLFELEGQICNKKVELQRYWNRSKYQLPDEYIHDMEILISELLNEYDLLYATYSKEGGVVKFSHPSVVGSSYII